MEFEKNVLKAFFIAIWTQLFSNLPTNLLIALQWSVQPPLSCRGQKSCAYLIRFTRHILHIARCLTCNKGDSSEV